MPKTSTPTREGLRTMTCSLCHGKGFGYAPSGTDINGYWLVPCPRCNHNAAFDDSRPPRERSAVMKYIFIIAILSFIIAIDPWTPAWLYAVLAIFAAMMVGVLSSWLVRGK